MMKKPAPLVCRAPEADHRVSFVGVRESLRTETAFPFHQLHQDGPTVRVAKNLAAAVATVALMASFSGCHGRHPADEHRLRCRYRGPRSACEKYERGQNVGKPGFGECNDRLGREYSPVTTRILMELPVRIELTTFSLRVISGP